MRRSQRKSEYSAEAVRRFTESAGAYVENNYIAPAPPKPVAKDPDALGIRYSMRETEVRFRLKDDYSPSVLDSALRGPLKRRDISRIRRSLNDNADLSFVEKLIVIIREKGIKDSAVYKPAGIDRRLFSKIMSDISYSPSKDTALAKRFCPFQARNLFSYQHFFHPIDFSCTSRRLSYFLFSFQ